MRRIIILTQLVLSFSSFAFSIEKQIMFTKPFEAI